jgi:hypothetical protein
MPDERSFTLRQADLARADFAAIEDHLDFIQAQLARFPTRRNLLDMAALIVLCTAGLVLLGIEVLFR